MYQKRIQFDADGYSKYFARCVIIIIPIKFRPFCNIHQQRYFLPKRISTTTYPTITPSFSLASLCLSMTSLFRGSDGNFSRISRLYKSCAGGILVVEWGVDLYVSRNLDNS